MKIAGARPAPAPGVPAAGDRHAELPAAISLRDQPAAALRAAAARRPDRRRARAALGAAAARGRLRARRAGPGRGWPQRPRRGPGAGSLDLRGHGAGTDPVRARAPARPGRVRRDPWLAATRLPESAPSFALGMGALGYFDG